MRLLYLLDSLLNGAGIWHREDEAVPASFSCRASFVAVGCIQHPRGVTSADKSIMSHHRRTPGPRPVHKTANEVDVINADSEAMNSWTGVCRSGPSPRQLGPPPVPASV